MAPLLINVNNWPRLSVLALALCFSCCWLQLSDGLELYEEAAEEVSTETIWMWNKEEYPNPVTQPRFCRRMAPSTLCDPDDVLTPDQKNRLERIIKKIGEEAVCVCDSCEKGNNGLSLGVAIMKSLYTPYGTHPRKNAQDFAEHLRQSWALGSCDNDVLILLSTNDRQIYTSMGPTALSVFPTRVADDIFFQTRAHFTSGYYYQGLESMIESYYDTLLTVESKDSAREAGNKSVNVLLIISVIIGVICLGILLIALICFVKQRRESPGSKGLDLEGVFDKSFWRLKTGPRAAPKVATSTPKSVPEANFQYEACSIEEPATFETRVKQNENLVKEALREIEDEETATDSSEDEEEKRVEERSEYDEVEDDPKEDDEEDEEERQARKRATIPAQESPLTRDPRGATRPPTLPLNPPNAGYSVQFAPRDPEVNNETNL